MKHLIVLGAVMWLCSPAAAQDYKQGIYDTCLANSYKKAKTEEERKQSVDFCTCYAQELATNPAVSEITKKKLTTTSPKNINEFYGKPNLSNLDPEYNELTLLMAIPFQCLEKVAPNAIKITGETLGEKTRKADTASQSPLPAPNYTQQTYSGSFTKSTAEEISILYKRIESSAGVSIQDVQDQQLVAALLPDGVAYYFTQPQHPAHPAYIKLKVDGGKGYPVYTGGHASDKESFKPFFQDFVTAMNRQLGIK